MTPDPSIESDSFELALSSDNARGEMYSDTKLDSQVQTSKSKQIQPTKQSKEKNSRIRTEEEENIISTGCQAKAILKDNLESLCTY